MFRSGSLRKSLKDAIQGLINETTTSFKAASEPSARRAFSEGKPSTSGRTSLNQRDAQDVATKVRKLQEKGGFRLHPGGPVYTKETSWDFFKDTPFINALAFVNPPTPERIRGIVIRERTASVWYYARQGLKWGSVVLGTFAVAYYTPFMSDSGAVMKAVRVSSDVSVVNLSLYKIAWAGWTDLYALRFTHGDGLTALMSRTRPSQHPSTRVLALRALNVIARSDAGLETLRADTRAIDVAERILSDDAYRGTTSYEAADKYVRIPYDPEESSRQLVHEATQLLRAIGNPNRQPQRTQERLKSLPLVGWLYDTDRRQIARQ